MDLKPISKHVVFVYFCSRTLRTQGCWSRNQKKNRKKSKGHSSPIIFVCLFFFSAHFIVYSWFYLQLNRFCCWMLLFFWGWGRWMDGLNNSLYMNLQVFRSINGRSVEAHIFILSGRAQLVIPVSKWYVDVCWTHLEMKCCSGKKY